jgi:hypothetical protein
MMVMFSGLVLGWYGKDNPVADNDTAEGRTDQGELYRRTGGPFVQRGG